MSDTGKLIKAVDELAGPTIHPAEAYISEEYARAERDRLWRKVWLQAGRIEDIPEPGCFITYDILDDSVLITRTKSDTIRAFHNVCTHRGRRLVDTPPGARNARGKQAKFVCNFHGWTFNPEGKCIFLLERDNWHGALTDERINLSQVRVDTWGGWIWINLDPDCEPLRQYLDPVATLLDPFHLENMRYKWRKWGIFDCNWKVALEAFNETYHVPTTHPEFAEFGKYDGWAKPLGEHSHIGYDAPAGQDETKGKLRLGSGDDARVATARMQKFIHENVGSVTTRTLADAAARLVDELPPGTPADKVLKHWIESARRDDAARGVFWPEIDPQKLGESGTSCQIFPNQQIGHALNNALCYQARPFGYDPNKCIFEVAALELFPKDQEPQTDWVFGRPNAEDFGPVLVQDFGNMAAVQQGMKNVGFRGNMPNPKGERAVSILHYNLSRYMGTGTPRRLK